MVQEHSSKDKRRRTLQKRDLDRIIARFGDVRSLWDSPPNDKDSLTM